MSAASTPTSVTFSKSNPLATIWVPSKMGIFSSSKRRKMASWPLPTVSASIRSTATPGKSCPSSSAAFWVPTPTCFMALPQSGQIASAGSEWPQ